MLHKFVFWIFETNYIDGSIDLAASIRAKGAGAILGFQNVSSNCDGKVCAKTCARRGMRGECYLIGFADATGTSKESLNWK